MQKTCANGWCKAAFDVGDDDMRYYEQISPKLGGVTHAVPPPSRCPDCRQQRRLAWRNERTIYGRSCDLCKRRIVSAYPDSAPFPVYCVQCWWGDGWDPLSYGAEWDSRRPFLEQFKALRDRVPQLAIQNDEGIASENSEYCYDISRAKNCYRMVGSWYIQDCMYGLNCNQSRNLVDCNTVSIASELAYESLDSQRLYRCAYLQNCENCAECFFGFDLHGCKNCFACCGLRQKQFCIFNEQHTEEEYRKKMAEFALGSHAAVRSLREQFDAWSLRFPRKFANIQNSEECVGNNIFNSKLTLGYSVFNTEYSKFIDRSDGPKNCYDLINSGGPEWCCDCVTPDNSYMTHFSVWCWKCKNALYSDNCHSSEHVLGCISLRRARHCILNKQYAPEEYERVASQVVDQLRRDGEWGELLPVALSPYGYNESGSFEYYPVDRAEALRRGWRWNDQLPFTVGKETKRWSDVPDRIEDAPDTITEEILACEECQKNYKITPQELLFYRSMPAPLPRQCPDCRHLARFRRKTPTRMWNRQCAQCQKPIQTTYAPDRPEIVYCEECYLREVY